jgi:two-component system nitrate/nitrite response regulator NarL
MHGKQVVKPMVESITRRINIVVVDDHALFRSGVRLLVESSTGMQVAGEAADSAAALAIAIQQQPDIILLDLDLDDENGLDVLPDLLAACAARVIVVTGVRAIEAAQQAVLLGAMGVVRKDQAAETLLEAIKRVYAGEVWLEPSLVARVLAERSRKRTGQPQLDPELAKIARLTAREREIITLIGTGLYNKQIAQRLSITETTVSHHLTSIFDKLGLTSRFDLVVYAYRHALAKPG